MNIYEKMAAITAELSAVAKNLQVGEGRSSYKAVGEADVLAAVKAAGLTVTAIRAKEDWRCIRAKRRTQ